MSFTSPIIGCGTSLRYDNIYTRNLQSGYIIDVRTSYKEITDIIEYGLQTLFSLFLLQNECSITARVIRIKTAKLTQTLL